jgi:hypothetical protein
MDPLFDSLEAWVRRHSEFLGLTLLIIIGWIIRVFLAINTGGMVHPDEIYQSLEIAHDLKYGYGFIPWEFKIPSSTQPDGASRSYLFPLLFFFIFELCETFGIPYQIDGTLRVVRFFSATYCTLLIPIVYYFSKELLPPQKPPHAFSLFTAFLTTFWFQFPFFGIRTLTNSFVTPIIFGALYLHLRTTNRMNGYSSLKIIVSEFIAGFLLALACSFRMDSVVFFAPFFILRHQNNRKMLLQYILLFIGFVVMFFFQGLTDLHFFGTFLASPINWFKFNILEGKSSKFGVQPFFYYFGKLLVRPFYSVNFALIAGLLIYKIQNTLHKFSGKIHDMWFFATLELLLWVLMSIIVLSSVEHKEERFMFSIFPVIMILFAAAMKEYFLILKDLYLYLHELKITNAKFTQFLFPKTSKLGRMVRNFLLKFDKKPTQKDLAIIQLVLLIVAALFTIQRSINASDNIDWAFFHDVNKSLEWTGDQENSTGIIVFSQWFYTGGWTHLHKNISMKFYNDPEANQRWQDYWISDPEYNYLVTPHYQYWRHENLKQQINYTSSRLINTIDGKVDIWYLNTTINNVPPVDGKYFAFNN